MGTVSSSGVRTTCKALDYYSPVLQALVLLDYKNNVITCSPLPFYQSNSFFFFFFPSDPRHREQFWILQLLASLKRPAYSSPCTTSPPYILESYPRRSGSDVHHGAGIAGMVLMVDGCPDWMTARRKLAC